MGSASTAKISLFPANRNSLGGASTPRDADRAWIPKLGVTHTFIKDEGVFAEGDRSAFFHRVLRGVIRTSQLLKDGRRQIDAFHFAGDIFGVEAGAEHRFSAEAVGDASVSSYPRRSFAGVAPGDSLGLEVFASIRLSLERAQDHIVLLGRKSACEKIASFLLFLAKRHCVGDVIELPMSRMDMADHLGITIETVSRCLTELEHRSVIARSICRHEIKLLDRAALGRLNS